MHMHINESQTLHQHIYTATILVHSISLLLSVLNYLSDFETAQLITLVKGIHKNSQESNKA